MVESGGGSAPSRAVEASRSRLTDLGCPDCSGVLALEELPHHRHVRFSCRVGHGFSHDSLMEAKEEQLERAFWTAIATCGEIESLCADIVKESGTAHAAAYARRGEWAAEVSARLRQLLADDKDERLKRRES